MSLNKEKYYWLNDSSRLFLSRGYLDEGQTGEERVRQIAEHAQSLNGVEGFADKFEEYMSQGWYSLSSPVWSNYGTDKGLPVSCFGSYVPDTMEGILHTHGEVGMMTKYGGGTSAYFGDLRPRGSEIQKLGSSLGPLPFIEMFEKLTNVVSQGSVRRGFFTAYMDIESDDFDEFVGIRTEGHPIQHITHGVCVGDDFMNKVIAGDEECGNRWARLLQVRSEKGAPYIFFKDTVNNNKPETLKGKTIKASNLCSEICLPSDKDESFVCVLSSMNILHYDEWKNTDAVEVMTMFLDTVCTEFLNKGESLKETQPEAYGFMKRAFKFTEKYRALGLGVLGWHSYLQSKMIPFESIEAAKLNAEIFKTIRSKSEQASKDMGGGIQKNATLMAVAPTKSSSFILGGVSQGIEPIKSNFFTKDLAKIDEVTKNVYLEELLETKGKNTRDVWNDILKADGSVQDLDFLSQEEKDVFKTSFEISPASVISQAAVRQTYIDQSQSLNLAISSDTPVKVLNKLYLDAWRQGVKTLYYQHGLSAAQELQREKLGVSITGCSACEG